MCSRQLAADSGFPLGDDGEAEANDEYPFLLHHTYTTTRIQYILHYHCHAYRFFFKRGFTFSYNAQAFSKYIEYMKTQIFGTSLADDILTQRCNVNTWIKVNKINKTTCHVLKSDTRTYEVHLGRFQCSGLSAFSYSSFKIVRMITPS